MIIVIEALLVMAAVICSFAYINRKNIKGRKGLKEIINVLIKALKTEKRKTFFIIVQCLAGIGMITVLNLVYEDNSWIANVKLITLIMILFPCAWNDYETHLVSNKILLAGLLLRILYMIPELVVYQGKFFGILADDFIGALVIGIFLIICTFAVKSGIGMGDIKLLMLMAFFQGSNGIIGALFFSLWIAFFASIALLIRRKKRRKDVIPFVPFILIGTYISVMLTGI